MKSDNSNKHGGQRKGAGRKKKEPTKVLSMRIPAKATEKQKATAKNMLKEFFKKKD